jgi:hypothetical protein
MDFEQRNSQCGMREPATETQMPRLRGRRSGAAADVGIVLIIASASVAERLGGRTGLSGQGKYRGLLTVQGDRPLAYNFGTYNLGAYNFGTYNLAECAPARLRPPIKIHALGLKGKLKQEDLQS